MNIELLKEFFEKIIENEEFYGVQNALDHLRAGLENLASNPQDQAQQTNVSKALAELQKAIEAFDSQFSPQEKEKLNEIEAQDFFKLDFVNEIKTKISENAISPAVVRDHVNSFTKKRRQYIENLTNLISNLDKIGIKVNDLEENEIQIGFQIPRELFHNNLDGLIVELNAIKKIIRTFSEATTGTVEEIKVGQISTTNPLVFLAQSAPVALAIAKTVNWILEKWKEVEEIRHLRAQTAQIKHFTKNEIGDFYDKKIKEVIDKSIEEKVKEILEASSSEDGRKNELEKALKDAIKSLFARIERGMTIELRMLPLEESEDTEDESENIVEENFSALKSLQDLQVTLKFPEPNANPILQIPKAKTKDKAEDA